MMAMNRKLTPILLDNIPFYMQPHSEDLGYNNTSEGFTLSKRSNCSIHITVLYIMLSLSVVISVCALFIFKSSNHAVLDDQTSRPVVAVYENASQSPFECNIQGSSSKNWYYHSEYNPGYACATFKVVSTINFQQLRVNGHVCNDTEQCYSLIHTYLGIMEEHSKFGFFIDSDGNVYGGRGWFCEFWTGQIWVAVMVDGFEAASEAEKGRILSRFREEVIPRAKKCVVSESDLHFNYYDETVI